MGIIDQSKCPVKAGSIYPEPYASQMAGRWSLRLGQAAGLTQFGANLVVVAPGARSSLRHWHRDEDEFVAFIERFRHVADVKALSKGIIERGASLVLAVSLYKGLKDRRDLLLI